VHAQPDIAGKGIANPPPLLRYIDAQSLECRQLIEVERTFRLRRRRVPHHAARDDVTARSTDSIGRDIAEAVGLGDAFAGDVGG